MSRQPRSQLQVKHLVLIFLALACVVALTVEAADGDLNVSFGSGGKVTTDFSTYFSLSEANAITAAKRESDRRAKLSHRITVHATGRGNPWINLSDGREVLTGYTGAAELRQALEQNLARSLSPASADFDEDGVLDLIAGYAGPGGGIITLHQGNVDSIYANAPEAQHRKANGTYTDSPFLSPAHVFEVAEAANFVGGGDFVADSHWDVVAAARGGNALWLLPGDRKGGFGPARRIDLPGRVTTLVTGEINRADGLADSGGWSRRSVAASRRISKYCSRPRSSIWIVDLRLGEARTWKGWNSFPRSRRGCRRCRWCSLPAMARWRLNRLPVTHCRKTQGTEVPAGRAEPVSEVA
jgi:hypothetical protein